MNMKYWKWWTVSCSGFIAYFVCYYFFDINTVLLENDQTYISLLILSISAIFSLSLVWNYEKVEDGQSNIYWYTSDMVLSLGMIGTLVGFLIVLGQAFLDIDPSNIESMKTAIVVLAKGMSTALVTTLTGLIVSVWMKLQLVIIEN